MEILWKGSKNSLNDLSKLKKQNYTWVIHLSNLIGPPLWVKYTERAKVKEKTVSVNTNSTLCIRVSFLFNPCLIVCRIFCLCPQHAVAMSSRRAVGANCSQPGDNDYMFLSPTLTLWHWRPHNRHFRTVTVYRPSSDNPESFKRYLSPAAATL